VTDDLGRPVAGATVATDAGGFSGVTDSLGAYRINGVVAGTYHITCTHAHYFDTTLAASVAIALEEQVGGVDAVLRRNPLYFTGGISGLVLDSATHSPLTGVVVAAAPGAYTGTTDAQGRFVIAAVPFGTYAVAASVNHRSNSRGGILVSEGDTADADTLWAVRSDVLLREVNGTLTGNIGMVQRIVVTVTGDGIDSASPVIKELTWLPISLTYTGDIFVPEQGILWRAEVRVYDGANRVVGYQGMAFDRGAATVAMPSFDAGNAMPHVQTCADTTVSIVDKVFLTATVTDSYTVTGLRPDPGLLSVLTIEWAVGPSGSFNPSRPDTTITVPATPQTTYPCVVRVTDDEGNRTYDTVMVNVVLDPPTVSLGVDRTASISDQVALSADTGDVFGSVVACAWDIGARGLFRPGRPDTTILAAASPTVVSCVVRVTDDDGNMAYDTMALSVVLDAPVADAGQDTALGMGTSYVLHGAAQQQFGTVTEWAWAVGSDTLKVRGADTTITLPDYFIPSYRCVLRVTDDDGNVDHDTVMLTVGCTWEAMGTATLSTAEARSISVRTRDDLNDPVVFLCYVDQVSGFGRPFVRKWSGSAWNIYGGGSPMTSGYTYRAALGIGRGYGGPGGTVAYDVPMLGYLNESVDSASVRYGGGWAVVGTRSIYPGNYGSVCEGLEVQGVGSSTAYLMLVDMTTSRRLLMYSGSASSAWTQQGGVIASNVVSMSFDRDEYGGGHPHVAYLTGTGASHTCTVKKLVSGTWNTVGRSWTTADNGTLPTEDNERVSLVMNADTPYVAFIDPQGADGATVVKFAANTWSVVGNRNFSQGAVKHLSLACDRGMLYAAYLDVSMGDRITVRHFDGSSWMTVGPRGFTSQNMKRVSIAVGNPSQYTRAPQVYLAFGDADNGHCLKAMRLR
jgi:hypothetical protein